MSKLTGINLAMQTLMHADGSIDYARWEELIDIYIGCDFQDGESLDYWRRTAAEIDGDRVRIGREELLGLIARIPSPDARARSL